MKAVVKRVEFPAGRRILAVSDIHGNLPWFRALLDKAGYTGDDILGQHRTENCVQKMSLRGKIKT